MTRILQIILALLVSVLLGACGTDSSGSGSSGGDDNDASGFSLRLTDAPFDDAVGVTLAIEEVKLRSKTGGGWISLPVLSAPQSIDLMQLQGTKTEEVMFDKAIVNSIPEDDYDELRLVLSSASMANTIELSAGGTVELKVPSGSTSGLKIKGDFTISKNRTTALTADVDLRQSIKKAGPNYILNPVIRLVQNNAFGHITGTVDFAKLGAPTCSDFSPTTYNAVYVYSGHNIVPDDIDQSSSTDVDPIATTTVELDVTIGTFTFEAAFLPVGDYTIAVTCNANLENLDGDDELLFFDIQNVTVMENDTLFL